MTTLIVGGGLAGLTCGWYLHQAGHPFQILEATDRVGGRVKTDLIDGYRLDHGFQVFLDAYPEAAHVLDVSTLDLRSFEPGAMVRFAGGFHRLADPLRRPQYALSAILSSLATLSDKLRVATLRGEASQCDLTTVYTRPDRSTISALRDQGFSDLIIERFFRPFLGGVFLDRQLETSSRMFQFVFRMFATGAATLPALGMEEIPKQIAGKLPSQTIRCHCRVTSVHDHGVTLDTGENVAGDRVVMATEGPTAAYLLPKVSPRSMPRATLRGRGVTCLYYSLEEMPISEPILILNGEEPGPINHLCFPSQLSNAYAPSGASLASISVLGVNHQLDQLQDTVTRQLSQWFGKSAQTWCLLGTYEIPYSLPSARQLEPVVVSSVLAPGRYICGDHCDTPSINGAMASGRRAAEAILAEASAA